MEETWKKLKYFGRTVLVEASENLYLHRFLFISLLDFGIFFVSSFIFDA